MDWLQGLQNSLGYGDAETSISAGEAALRALVTYAVVILALRAGAKRAMGKNTAFDLILAIMLGSVVSRGITGNAPLGTSLVAGVVLIGAHWLLATVAFHWSRFGTVVKGRSRELVREGRVLDGAMRRSHISRLDLEEAMRHGGAEGLDEVVTAYLERDGRISVVHDRKEPRVVDVRVEEGVQTVRLELH